MRLILSWIYTRPRLGTFFKQPIWIRLLALVILHRALREILVRWAANGLR